MGSSLSKLALSAGSTAECRGAVECQLAEEGMQTTTCSWYKPIVVWGANLYWFMSQPIVVGGSNL